MGTKLHRINNLLITTLRKSNCNVVVNVGLKASHIRALSDNISVKVSILGDLNQLKRCPMERLLEFYDTDSVRDTILKHEEIFRQQVHELHRLYRVQKVLMAELGNKQVQNLHAFPSSEAATAAADTRTRVWSNATTSDTSHSSHVSNVHRSAAAQLNSKCRSLNPCSTSRELSICFDLEQPAEECTSRGATSINDQNAKRSTKSSVSWTDDGSEIELTLSIGSGSYKKNPEQERGMW